MLVNWFEAQQLSKDKKRLFFQEDKNYVFDFDSREVTPIQIPPDCGAYLVYKRPDFDSVLYGIEDKNHQYFTYIRHYNIDTSTLIKDYRTVCVKPFVPNVVGQSLDGSKLVYTCSGASYYLKTLNDPNSKDRTIINSGQNGRNSRSASFNDPLISPDGSKVIFKNNQNNFWTIFNLNYDDPMSKTRKNYFSVNPKRFKQLSVSDDMTKLYFVIKNDAGEIRLYDIDYNSLFNNNYSSQDRALDIRQGQLIELGPEN